MLDLPDITIGAIIAALIASLFSFLGLIISKEQKTSEFRQEWINSLRQEISKFISATKSIYASTVKETTDENAGRLRPTNTDLTSLDEAAAIIRLRLNPTERLSQNILKEVGDMENILNQFPNINYKDIKACQDKLICAASRLLKHEWERVKRGEWTYRAAKCGVLGLILIILIVAAVSFFKSSEAEASHETIEHCVECDTTRHKERGLN